MPIDFDCAVCKHRIRVPDGAEGKRTKCPKCQAIQPVPSELDELRLKDSPSEPPPTRSSHVEDTYRPTEPESPPPQRNPFADSVTDSPTNPYAPPASGEDAVKVNTARMEAMERLQTPVLISLILAGLGIAANVVTLIIAAINIIGEGARENDIIHLAGYSIGFAFAIGLLGFACFGLMQARDLKNYGLAWAGFIITLLPCSCIFPLSLPISIWGMMVLSDNSVQRQFTS